MENPEDFFRKGDLVNVLSNYKEIIVATGIYLGLDMYEMNAKVLLSNSKIREFDLTFYYLEKLN
tara:strand:- start:2279 stop:2470 length:192 start_codon:yes stop_codon:yes gene_type:complete